MRIVLFTETYLPYINGVVTHVKSLKDGLERTGHQVLIVTADIHSRHHHIEDGVLWCPAKEFKKFYSYGLASPVSLKRLRLIKEFAPDIIHIHAEFGVGLSGVSIARTLKVPLVYTLHTMYDDYLYYAVPQFFIPVAKKITHTYVRIFTDNASAITGPSKKVEHFLRGCGVARPVEVVPNPVELDCFNQENIDPLQVAAYKKQFGIQPDEQIVCFCGRLGKEKNVNTLLSYFANQYKPEDRIRLMIIGDGPDRESLQQQAKELGIGDAVIFTGKVAHESLLQVYACCNMYITTSLSDTNSISMLEAMATGLPVLHIYDELNAGQVIHGVNGFIFSNAEEMYNQMCRYRDLSVQKKQALSYSVQQSVKKSGQQNLANYLLDVYQYIEQNKKHTKRIPIFELKYKDRT